MYAYTVNAQMHLFMHGVCANAWKPCRSRVGAFLRPKKNPHGCGFFLNQKRLAGVHAPPEDVTEDGDLLFLDLLEAVVLIRVFVAIEAAQADPGR